MIWPSLIILFCFIILVYLRITSFQKMLNTIRSSYSMQAIKQLEREEFNPFNPTSFALSLLFILMLAFFLFKLNSEFGGVLMQRSEISQYLFFVLCICLFLPFKFGIKKIVGFVCDTPNLFNEIFYNNLVINQSLGVLLLPIMIVVEFSQVNPAYLLIATGILISMGLLMKLYRGVVFSLFDNHIGLLQVFIYLCALEILPFLVLLKFIITNF